jgi:drug/metabolite transporter (DMT)-like permease
LWFAQASLAYTTASVTSVLTTTAPLFILPLSVWFLNEEITTRAVIGAVLAVIGVALMVVS